MAGDIDLTEIITDLLKEHKTFAAVRVYSECELTGTVLVVAGERVYSRLKDDELARRLTKLAHRALAAEKSESQTVPWQSETIEVFVEVLTPQPTILIAGAGHIALPLAQMAKIANFRVVVLDDRPEYACAARFPTADQILVQPFVAALREYPFNSQTYLVLITRGHTFDRDCLAAVLDKPAAYIGMIGSRRRLAAVLELLAQQGFSRDCLRRVHAPIGLPIGGNTPEAIAVSILAEILSVRYQGSDWSLSLKDHFARI